MQRLLLATIAVLGIAGVVGTTGYSAEPQEADVGPPAAAGEISVQPPRDLKDVALAVKPRLSERRPSVVANPKHPEQLALAVVQGEGDERCTIRRSDDGGRSWAAPVSLPRPGGASCRYVDLAYAPDGGRLYAAYDAAFSKLVVSSSTDNGGTWQPPVVALQGDNVFDEGFILPNLATPRQPADRDVLYLTASVSDSEPGVDFVFVRSTDGGQTWGGGKLVASGDSLNNVVGGQIAGGNGGELLISWFEEERGPDFRPAFWIIRSADYGANFDLPVRVATDYAGDGSDVEIGPAGVAHLVYERRSRRLLKDLGDIGYTWSEPPYKKWAAPVTISDGARPRQQTEPSLVVEPCGNGSVLHVIWRDGRLSPASDPDRFSDIFYSRKLARAGAAWSANLRISDRSSLIDSGGYARKPPEIAGGAGRLFAVWTDRRDKTDPSDIETDVYGSGILSGIDCR